MAGAPAQKTRRFDRGLCVGQSVSDRLMLDDRVNATALFGAGKMQGEVERRAHQCDAEDADKCRGRSKGASRQRKPRTLLSEQIVVRRLHILQTELRYEVRPVADRV